MAANHPSKHDPFVLSSGVFDKRVRFLAGGTGLTKDPLFRGPLRPVFEYTGTVPVFRAKNYEGTAREVHDAAAARPVEVVDGLVVAHGHLWPRRTPPAACVHPPSLAERRR